MPTPIHLKEPLVLGSASPRRRAILESLLVPHVVAPADVDERVLPGEGPEAYLERIVRAKLAAVSARLLAEGAHVAAPRLILVADTLVLDAGEILGKPRDRAEAEAMIVRLSARTHQVRTRFALGHALGPQAESSACLHEETVTTSVTFRAVSAAEARAYAERGEGMDKAGGYAVQGLAAAFVSRLEGSYANVVGLPACELMVAFARLGLR